MSSAGQLFPFQYKRILVGKMKGIFYETPGVDEISTLPLSVPAGEKAKITRSCSLG